MIQKNQSADFSHLKALVVDDFTNFANALKRMLEDLGVRHISLCRNGEDALATMATDNFDLVLCDYNMGEGANGNDVLEEARQRRLLRSAAIFVMITAENTADLVRGALEYQPDDYLTKPFTKEVLDARLRRLQQRRAVFAEVHKLRDKGDNRGAAKVCEALAAQSGRHAAYARKLQADLLLEAEAYDEARGLFEQVLMVKNLAWARLGLGKCYFYAGQLEEALRHFQLLLDADGGYVQAWDWVARCKEELGDAEGAQAALEKAVQVSPVNTRRQARLGATALANEDYERAELAYGRAVKVGRNSVYRDPENYLRLGEVLVHKLESAEGLARKSAETKALGALEDLRKLYRHDPAVTLQSRLMDEAVYRQVGNESAAETALLKAYEASREEAGAELPAEVREQLLSRLEAAGQQQRANELIAAMQQEESGRNRQAIAYYEQGNLQAALAELRLAVREKPRSFAVNLNFAQVALRLMQQSGVEEELLDQVGRALERVEGMSPEHPRADLCTRLEASYQKMRAGRSPQNPGHQGDGEVTQ